MKKKIIQHRTKIRSNKKVEEKYCPSCKRWLELDNFGTDKRAWDKRYHKCKQCRKEGKVLATKTDMLEPSKVESITTKEEVLATKEEVLATKEEVLATKLETPKQKLLRVTEEQRLEKEAKKERIKQALAKERLDREWFDMPYDMR